MPDWRALWNTELLSNTVGDWTLAIVVLLLTLTVLPLLRGLIAARRKRWLESRLEVPSAIGLSALLIERTSRVFVWAVAFYFALDMVSLPHRFEHALQVAIVFVFWFQVGLWGMAAVRFAIDRRRQHAPADPAL